MLNFMNHLKASMMQKCFFIYFSYALKFTSFSGNFLSILIDALSTGINCFKTATEIFSTLFLPTSRFH